jgi:hypothetical protein
MIRHRRESSETTPKTGGYRRGRKRRIYGFFKNARPILQSGLRNRAGFTLIEIAFACEVMMLLTLIGFNETRRVREYAKVAACMQYQASIQRSLWADFAVDGDFTGDLNTALARLPDCSLGNDFEYTGGGAAGLYGEYYLRCNHDHSYVAVLFVDSGSYHAPKAIYNLASARGTIP